MHGVRGDPGGEAAARPDAATLAGFALIVLIAGILITLAGVWLGTMAGVRRTP